ncbi:uncharacterized protein LOC123888025 [Trifolium pratense]|uniref:uncharacterized protein LOC123888025 n=1 Tax=Trifolium pratense TaxID=57577 RepID=UPI001E697FE3|nr:uncharacterized protein LOC123888025 [Trifolium pratense]
MSPNHHKEQEEALTKFEIVKNTTDQTLEESSNSHHNSKEEEEEKEHIQIEECSKTPSSSSSSSSSSSEKLKNKDEEEEEDGFRTPTSLDHKISVLTCPPTPKKIKQSLKRKADSYNNQYFSCRQLPLDLSKEVELLFPTTHHIPLSDHSHTAKKIRRGDQEQK